MTKLNRPFALHMIVATVAATFAIVLPPVAAADEPPVKVEGWAEHVADTLVYRYRVRNIGTRTVGEWKLGFDQALYDSDVPKQASDYSQLLSVPRGAVNRNDRWQGGEFGSPPNWTAEIREAQDTSGISILWDSTIKEANLGPGAVADFSVTVPAALEAEYAYEYNDKQEFFSDPAGRDADYLNGSFTAYFTYQPPGALPDADFEYFSGKVTPVDASAPSLTLKMSPSSVAKLGGTSLKVQAILTTTDSYDPKPQIKLESITASVPLNQSEIKGAVFGTDDRLFILPVKKDPTGKPVVYTVTYSAMDGTGNKSTASATVTLNP